MARSSGSSPASASSSLIVLPTQGEMLAMRQLERGAWQHMPLPQLRLSLEQLGHVQRSLLISQEIGGDTGAPLICAVRPELVVPTIALDPVIVLLGLTEKVREVTEGDSDMEGVEIYKPWKWYIDRGMSVRRKLIKVLSATQSREQRLNPDRLFVYLSTLLEDGQLNVVDEQLGIEFAAYLVATMDNGQLDVSEEDFVRLCRNHPDPEMEDGDEWLDCVFEIADERDFTALEADVEDTLAQVQQEVAAAEAARTEQIRAELGGRAQRVEDILAEGDVDALLAELELGIE